MNNNNYNNNPNNNNKFYNEVSNKLRSQCDQFKLINTSMETTSSTISEINKKLYKYKDTIGESGKEVNKLKNKLKKEKRFFKFALYFYIACLIIIVLRRVPLIFVYNILSYIYSLIYYAFVSIINIYENLTSLKRYHNNYTNVLNNTVYSNTDMKNNSINNSLYINIITDL